MKNRSAKLDAEREVFRVERDEAANGVETEKRAIWLTKPYVKDHRGWVLFGPMDIRLGEAKHGFLFGLQQLKGQTEPRVRVGCRYYTLKEAWKHWSFKAKTGKSYARESYGTMSRKNEGKQAIAIIRLMLLQARAYHLIGMYAPFPKFDSTLMKPKRKPNVRSH